MGIALLIVAVIMYVAAHVVALRSESPRAFGAWVLLAVMSVLTLTAGIYFSTGGASEKTDETPASCEQAYAAIDELQRLGPTAPDTPERRESDFWENEFTRSVEACRRDAR